MAKNQSHTQPTWADVKRKLADYDRAQLLSLVHDLYGAQKDNQTFLHGRLGLSEDPLAPYKQTIARWLWPDILGGESGTTSIPKAKQAISSYKKAIGQQEGLAELMVFYCEQAAGFCADVGYQDEAHFNSLLRVFGEALKPAHTLPASLRRKLIGRLNRVRAISHKLGYGVGEEMDRLLSQYVTLEP